MDKGNNGHKPPDVFKSGSGQGEGESSAIGEARKPYASVPKSVHSPYKRMDLTFMTPTLVEGKPLIELPTSVVMVGAQKWRYTMIGTTSEQNRLTYARVCVEVRVDSQLFDELPVRYSSGQQFIQKVVYEWVLLKCKNRNKFGHAKASCKVVQIYVPKQMFEVGVGKAGLEEVTGDKFDVAGERVSEPIVVEDEVPEV
ncbi:hypothetical protein LIER_31640 [Lithospermum erythrorhizon]|uniref:Uncharacterized protein n=1 Tax=Lithospermum erythrorhizon TaxID=34254 RepID=A0AAV3RVJ9_LITER